MQPASSGTDRAPSRPGAARRMALGLFPLVLLGTVIGAVALARSNPRLLFVVLFVAAAAVPLAWVTVSALWPARADRRCPQCEADALERLDAHATHGLACRVCGWRDESASAWLLAEEEGPLEALVLARRRRSSPAGGRIPIRTTSNTTATVPPVDSTSSAG